MEVMLQQWNYSNDKRAGYRSGNTCNSGNGRTDSFLNGHNIWNKYEYSVQSLLTREWIEWLCNVLCPVNISSKQEDMNMSRRITI